MPNLVKIDFLNKVEEKYGKLKKLPGSLSLFEIGEGICRIYIRYSKVHSRNQSFMEYAKMILNNLKT